MCDLIIPKEVSDSFIDGILKNLEAQMLRITSVPKERLGIINTLPKLGSDIIWCGHVWQSCMEGYRLINPSNPWQWYSEHCIRITDSNSLILTMEKDPRDIRHWDGEIYKPTYGVGTLRSKEAFGYGTFKAKVMCPEGKGLWPSFWLSCKETYQEFLYERNHRGKSLWPYGGEIDGMEAWSGDGNYFKLFIAQPPYFKPSWRTTTNIHYAIGDEHKSIGSRNIPWCKQRKNPVCNYIEYEIEWLPEKITLKANDKIVRQDTASAIAITKYWKSINMKPGMAVIFDLWVDDPSKNEIRLRNDMYIKDFSYIPMK